MNQNRFEFLNEFLRAGNLQRSPALIFKKSIFDTPISEENPLAWMTINGAKVPVLAMNIRSFVSIPTWLLNNDKLPLEFISGIQPQTEIDFVLSTLIEKAIEPLDILKKTIFDFTVTAVGFNLSMSGKAIICDASQEDDGVWLKMNGAIDVQLDSQSPLPNIRSHAERPTNV